MISLLSVLSLLASGALAQTQVSLYGQCGGTGWDGATECSSGSVCTNLNSSYSQCLPDVASSSDSQIPSSETIVPTSVSQPTTSAVVSSTVASTSASIPVPSGAPANAEWAAALVKARAAVARLTVEEKVSLGTGTGWTKGACLGNIAAIPSIDFPGLCLQDSPVGVRLADKVSAFPAAVNVASTFNRDLMRARGVAMGNEFRGKGVHIALAPMMNLARAPAGGRNWEGFGADPYLSGEAAYESIVGLQSAGVQATAKHFLLNEQEHHRETSSSDADDRTTHEVYLKPFLRSVQANVASVMCSYNQLNGTYACENDKALNGLLKGEFGFQGYVMSDWQATHSTLSVNQGLDMNMPGEKRIGSGTTGWFGEALVSAVNSGLISQARIDDLASRILAPWYMLKQDSGFPAVNFDTWTPSKGSHVDVQSNHKELIRKIGAASTVLLKNTNSALPLKAPKTIGIVGNGAGANPDGPNACVDRGCTVGVLAMGWGSGTADYPYLITPLDAITARAELDGTTVSSSTSDSDLDAAGSVAAGKDVTFVFITANSGEGFATVEGHAGDRNDLKAWHNGDALVQKVASVSENTIVVCNTVGAIVMEWANHPNVTAIVWSGLPGQEAGNSLVDVLYGSYNPSGRLPYTIAHSEQDYSARVIYDSNQAILPIPYTEGLFIDYFGFDKAKIAPQFEFGFGLSYTNFAYSELTVSGSTAGGSSPSGPGSSLDPWLHDKVITVSVTVRNNGTVAGTEIPQLYTSPPDSAETAPYLLRGFDSVDLAVGESKVVTFGLSRYDLSVWDVVKQQWSIPAGTTSVSVGASSRDLRLSSVVPV